MQSDQLLQTPATLTLLPSNYELEESHSPLSRWGLNIWSQHRKVVGTGGSEVAPLGLLGPWDSFEETAEKATWNCLSTGSIKGRLTGGEAAGSLTPEFFLSVEAPLLHTERKNLGKILKLCKW